MQKELRYELDLAGPRPTHQRNVELGWGLAVLVAVGSNVIWHVTHGRWFEAFWLCNAAALVAGLALWTQKSLLATVAFIWLVPGTAAWAAEALLLGSSFAWPSYALHLTGAIAAVLGIRRFGAHRAGYVAALALLALLLLVSRLLPLAANVNCAFGPRAGWWVFQALPLPHWGALAVMALSLSFAMNGLAGFVSPKALSVTSR
ncbi:MAG TPA: hypothetical protein VGP93_08035 [Polyangiaceae bacterium]|nr:hypothetical protein [Polyangiaceae bacterium]